MRLLSILLLSSSFACLSSSRTFAQQASCIIQKSDAATLTVVVQGPGNSGPIPGAWIRVQHWGGGGDPQKTEPVVDTDRLSDAQGVVKVKLSTQGFYDVFASAPAFFPAVAHCEMHAGYAGQVTFHLPLVTGSGLEWSSQKPL